MTRSQGEEEAEGLKKKFQNLEDDWNSYKQSIPGHRRSCSMTDVASAVSSDLFKLLHDSPKKLVSSLQRSQPSSEVSQPTLGDRHTEDIVTERRAGMMSGKLRGRKLLEALEGAREEAITGLHGREEICSVCSSVLIQGCDANSSCSCSSSLPGMHGYNYGKVYLSSSSSSAATSFSMENVEKEREVGAAKMDGFFGGGGERWMWRMCWLSIVPVFLAWGLIAWREFGMEEHDQYMIPT